MTTFKPKEFFAVQEFFLSLKLYREDPENILFSETGQNPLLTKQRSREIFYASGIFIKHYIIRSLIKWSHKEDPGIF